MAAFRFAAADASGKEQSGVLEADSARLARQLLRGRGLIPLTVEPVSHQASGRGRGGLSIGRRLGQTELAVITRQLASLLGAQLPVAEVHVRSPKSAVPIRMIVAPSWMATSKSWLIPMERCLFPRQPGRRDSSASRRRLSSAK